MKILQVNKNKYLKIIEQHNQFFKEKMNFENIITEAIENCTEESDWEKLKHFSYREKNCEKGYYWDLVYYRIPFNLYSKVKKFIKDDLIVDDIVNFSLLNYLSFFEIKAKKNIIDNCWSEDNLIKVLTTINVMEDECDYKVNGLGLIETPCYKCEHEHHGKMQYVASWYQDFIPYFKCIKCGETGNIWDLIDDKENTKEKIDFLWDLLIEGKNVKINKSEITFEGTKRKREEEQIKRIEEGKIITAAVLKDSNNDLNYMYKLGFKKEDITDDVVYRGDKIGDNYESNLWRFRIVYIIRDIDGNIVGIKGRQILEKDEWDNLLETDDFFKKQCDYRARTLLPKTINVKGCQISKHLFLLYKYVRNPKKYKKLLITEGEKDALRVYSMHIPGIACVSSFGCNLSREHIGLIKETFGTKITIVLAYDNDNAGVEGNLMAYKKLKEAGFNNIYFAIYPSNIKDFGDISAKQGTYKIISGIVNFNVSINKYKEEIIKKVAEEVQSIEKYQGINIAG